MPEGQISSSDPIMLPGEMTVSALSELLICGGGGGQLGMITLEQPPFIVPKQIFKGGGETPQAIL